MKNEQGTTANRENAAFNARKAKAYGLMKEEQEEALYLVLAEVLFILLPFLAIGTVFYFKGKLHALFIQPEWALAASVISGQAVVKFISGFLSAPLGRVAWQKISLGITLVIVFSITPSLLVLTLILNGEETQASTALVRSQIILFFLGLIIFIGFGWIGEALRAWARYKESTASPRNEDRALRLDNREPATQHTSEPSAGDADGNHKTTPADWKQWVEERARAGQPPRTVAH